MEKLKKMFCLIMSALMVIFCLGNVVYAEEIERYEESGESGITTESEPATPETAMLLLEDEETDLITFVNRGDFPFIEKVQITDENGVEISEKTFERDGKINIQFDFAIPNSIQLAKGDMYTVSIPEGFEIVDDISPRPFDEASGIDMTWELNSGIITIKNYQDFSTICNISGYMRIECWFSKDSQCC